MLPPTFLPSLATPIAASTAIDLSRLPAPAIVETLDYEAILSGLQADFAARWPAYSATVESDPVAKLLEVIAWYATIQRAQFNDRARGAMIAFASGADLDQLAALFGVTRLIVTPADPDTGAPAVMESDTDLRRRAVLAPDGFSVAGPANAYIFHALSADPAVLDATASSPSPGRVRVAILARPDADNPSGAPSADLIAAVQAALSADDVRPLTDHVTVVGAELVAVDLAARIWTYAGPDPALIIAAAQASVERLFASAHRLGRALPRSALIAALHVGGVARVELDSPVADIDAAPDRAAWAQSFVIEHAGSLA